MTKAEFRQLYELIRSLHSYARGQLRFSAMMYEASKGLASRQDIDANAIAAVHATNILQDFIAGELARFSDFEELSIEELQELLDKDLLNPEDAEEATSMLYFKQQSARAESMTDDEIQSVLGTQEDE